MNRLEIQKQYVTGVVVREHEPIASTKGGFAPWGVVLIHLRGNPDNPSDKSEIALYVDGNAASAARELARQLNEAATIADRRTQGLVAADAAE